MIGGCAAEEIAMSSEIRLPCNPEPCCRPRARRIPARRLGCSMCEASGETRMWNFVIVGTVRWR